jgi:glutathione S-transferase
MTSRQGRAMIEVWGRKNSSNVQKVMWAIGELGLPYQRIDVGLQFGGNNTAEYLAMNPNGLVPTIQDGDLILWESNAIVRYLANRYGAGTLEPADPNARARANQWMDWQLTVWTPAFWNTFHGIVRTPKDKQDPVAIAKSIAESIAVAKIFDAHLGRSRYVAGDAFSMGDIPFGIRVYRFRNLVPNAPPLPNIDRWYALIEKRPAYHEHVGSIPLT